MKMIVSDMQWSNYSVTQKGTKYKEGWETVVLEIEDSDLYRWLPGSYVVSVRHFSQAASIVTEPEDELFDYIHDVDFYEDAVNAIKKFVEQIAINEICLARSK